MNFFSQSVSQPRLYVQKHGVQSRTGPITSRKERFNNDNLASEDITIEPFVLAEVIAEHNIGEVLVGGRPHSVAVGPLGLSGQRGERRREP